jgi:hypothetical protein
MATPIQGAYGTVSQLAGANPQDYIAGLNPLQALAGQTAQQAGGGNYMGDAAAMTKLYGTGSAGSYAPANATAQSLLDNLSAYQNPYTDAVVRSSLNDFDVNAGHTLGQQRLDMGGSGAFGGSGAGLTQSMTQGELARARGSLDSGLRDQGFNTATTLSGQDAQRRQDVSLANANAANQAGQFNATSHNQALDRGMAAGAQIGQLGTANDASIRANAATQDAIGGDLRSVAQSQAGAPLALSSWANTNYAGLPSQLFVGQHTVGDGTDTTKTSDPLGSIAGLAMGLGSMGLAPFTGGASMGGLAGLLGMNSNAAVSGLAKMFGSGTSLLSNPGAMSQMSGLY